MQSRSVQTAVDVLSRTDKECAASHRPWKWPGVNYLCCCPLLPFAAQLSSQVQAGLARGSSLCPHHPQLQGHHSRPRQPLKTSSYVRPAPSLETLGTALHSSFMYFYSLGPNTAKRLLDTGLGSQPGRSFCPSNKLII